MEALKFMGIMLMTYIAVCLVIIMTATCTMIVAEIFDDLKYWWRSR
jgi:hypothetical protein